MKNGLVLEGGAMRGLFTAGIIDVFMENDIAFDGAVGVSAGAAFGCNYKSDQPRRVIRYNTRFCRDKRFCSVHSLIKTGDMFGAEFCYHEIPEKLDLFDFETYRNSPMKFYAVCTDVNTGMPVYHRCDTMNDTELEWIRASASMPMASRIVSVDGYNMLDGGISDSIPLKFMEKNGYERNVVILTQPRGYTKSKNSLLPLMKVVYRKYPALLKTIENRHIMYNNQLKYVRKAEKESRAYVIAPDEKLPVKRVEHDPEVLLEVYRIGRMAGMKHLASIRDFLK
ncbi:MAG: patatin family protein [Ruminococcus sp.]|nr:patatin family protein [Ruminococcus sp.]